MREIKFRAWDKGGNSIILWDELLEKFDPYEEGSGSTLDFILEYQGVGKEDKVLMQYTGIKNYESVEVYEGDILEDEYHNRGVVEWFYFGFEIKELGKSFNTTYEKCKVIGNIWETPNLIAEGKGGE